MLTIFAVPKPFAGHIDIIQRNAIGSWKLLRPKCEIILFGDERGTAETAAELGVRHEAEILRNEYGTPLVNHLFSRAEELSASDNFCFVNSDIMLLDSFMEALEKVRAAHSKFLAVGRRWNLDIAEPWDFDTPDWNNRLDYLAKRHGRLVGPQAIDFFAFPRGLWGNIPSFAVGRPAYDNWFIYRGRSLGAAVVDITEIATVVHQNHDYGHHKGGQKAIWEGPEAECNRDLAGGWMYIFDLNDVNWVLTKDGLRRPVGPQYSTNKIKRAFVLNPVLGIVARPLLLAIRPFRRRYLTWRRGLSAPCHSSRAGDG